MIHIEVKSNPEFEKELAALGGADVKLCFQCGTCTASCPSGRRTSYRVRKIMRMAQLDMKEEIISSQELWECSTCYTCVERCPRQVPIVDVIVALRNMAVAAGHIYPAHKKTAVNLYKTGHTVPINDEIKAQRKALGLPEVPPTVLSDSAAAADLKKILDATKFDVICKE
ncbi:MAG: CoB--CoM heterodisulfide reductase subunit C [Candidatus Methanomethylophilus sp.]|nr:CoB--CoM heterodisulfide reductase subunit C [Methanomethylophilus sp.]MDD3232818.1 CoB--CoM heterodisulfide reductase subunit C [Methanomethylophilus sp.]MDD4222930.1 CoB--CoM heterodisulfide reductase subunit C [Methanomethylophilus sp.]MDD4668973.1 CoB--CoM heterodisulfide reductase subunit C [Methanomethylophilus sp.]